ncbi:EamA family transporter [Prosthecochloris sp. SCSIO W1101]|uniref:EamA family transporter n=1 Tax=Prosthecochloris sp. SCSIO W1101 TaxID=2992242 RepID=UPI00223CEA6B|nr:EamA family transporter [Prosthecochloris sp. SCSIO W1101]UZJ40291.1 EamA family transporter [Prosthecochloris sp. SCSIO W1101]
MKTFHLYLSLIITVSIVGSLPILEKITLAKMNITQMIFYRSLSQTLILGIVVWICGSSLSSGIPVKYTVYALLQGVAITIMLFFYFSAIKTADVSFVYPLIAASPLITYILAIVVLNEPFNIIRLSGVILVIGGIILILHSK